MGKSIPFIKTAITLIECKSINSCERASRLIDDSDFIIIISLLPSEIASLVQLNAHEQKMLIIGSVVPRKFQIIY